MQINVAQLLKTAIGTIRNYEVKGVVDIGGNGMDSAVWGKCSLMRTDRGILVKGRLHTEAKVTCSRCLTLFSYPLVLDVEEEYFPTYRLGHSTIDQVQHLLCLEMAPIQLIVLQSRHQALW